MKLERAGYSVRKLYLNKILAYQQKILYEQTFIF